eukprot:1027394-Amphidinium_carterae.1
MYEYFEEEKSLYLVIELVTGGDLADMLQSGEFDGESEIKKTMLQLLHAIRYCHQKGVIHRDLKMENCLIDRKQEEKALK